MSRRARRTAAWLAPLALILIGNAAAETPPATDPAAGVVVDKLQAVLIEVMKGAETLGYEGRYQTLAPVLPEVFDLAFMAEKSVGRHWKTASPEDQVQLVDTFTRYIIATYAGRFTGWDGQEFHKLGQEPSARGTVLVRTRITDPNDEDVNLDYRLRQREDGSWKIIDVYLNGTVSELALRRSEYSSLIKREGFAALLVKLDERIETLSTTPADAAS